MPSVSSPIVCAPRPRGPRSCGVGWPATSRSIRSDSIHSGPTWLRGRARTPPLDLLQSIMEFAVVPVAVRPGGPLGTAIAPWKVRVGAPVQLDAQVPAGDPLGAAELGEAVRRAVDNLL